MKINSNRLYLKVLQYLIIINILIGMNLFLAKEQQKSPSILLMELTQGKVVSINLENWKTECLVNPVAKSFQPIGIKYYQSLNKVVFIAFNFDYHVGIVDLKTKRIKFLNLKQMGYETGIIDDIRISLDKPEEHIYILIAEKHLSTLTTNEEWENYCNTIKVICYNIKDDTWEEIFNLDHNHGDLYIDFNKTAYFPNGKITLFLQQRFAQLKKNRNDIIVYFDDMYENVFTNLVKNQILINSNENSILYLGERYVICRKDDQIIVVDLVVQTRPIIINESPKSFIKTNGWFLYSCATDLIFN